jgi:hypothetical protein
MAHCLHPVIGEVNSSQIAFLQIVKSDEYPWVPDLEVLDVTFHTEETLSTNLYTIYKTTVNVPENVSNRLALCWKQSNVNEFYSPFLEQHSNEDDTKLKKKERVWTITPLYDSNPVVAIASSNNIWTSSDDQGSYERLSALALKSKIETVIHLGNNVHLDPYMKNFLVEDEISVNELKNSFIKCYIKTWNQNHVQSLLTHTSGLFFTDEHDGIPSWLCSKYANALERGNTKYVERVDILVSAIESVTSSIQNALWLKYNKNGKHSRRPSDSDSPPITPNSLTISPTNSPSREESPYTSRSISFKNFAFNKTKSYGQLAVATSPRDSIGTDVVGLIEEEDEKCSVSNSKDIRFRDDKNHIFNYDSYILAIIPTWYKSCKDKMPSDHNPISNVRYAISIAAKYSKPLLIVVNGKCANYSNVQTSNYKPLYDTLLQAVKAGIELCFVSSKINSSITGELKYSDSLADFGVPFFTPSCCNDSSLKVFSTIRGMSSKFKLQPYGDIPISQKVKSSLLISFSENKNFEVRRQNVNLYKTSNSAEFYTKFNTEQ